MSELVLASLSNSTRTTLSSLSIGMYWANVTFHWWSFAQI